MMEANVGDIADRLKWLIMEFGSQCWLMPGLFRVYRRPVCRSDKDFTVDHRLFPAATTEFRVLPDAVSIRVRMLEISAVPAPLTDCRYTD